MALWDCKAIRQHKFPEEFVEFWNRLYSRNEYREANREFIDVLHLHRQYGYKNLHTAVGLALSYGAISYASVYSLCRQLITPSSEVTSGWPSGWINEKIPRLKEAEFAWDVDLSRYTALGEEVSHAN